MRLQKSWALIAANVALFACGRNPEPTEPTVSPLCPTHLGDITTHACAVVSGSVRDGKGLPLPGASVSVYSDTLMGMFLGSGVVRESGEFQVVLHMLDRLDHVPFSMSAKVVARATGPYPRPSPETLYADSVFTTVTYVERGKAWEAGNVALTIRFP